MTALAGLPAYLDLAHAVRLASAADRYLNAFHDPAWDAHQVHGRAWILAGPEAWGPLADFAAVNADTSRYASASPAQASASAASCSAWAARLTRPSSVAWPRCPRVPGERCSAS